MVHFWLKNLLCCLNKIRKILEWINLIVVSDLNGKIYAGPPSAYRPIRARLAQSGPGSPNQGPARRPLRGRVEEHLDHLNIREEAGGDCLGNSMV
jgi:hypothetical protein